MKFLHTSDWHLGKKLNGKITRYDEQKLFLGEIAKICESEKVEVLLVTGDVFDTFIPPAEAEEIFFNFLNEVSSPTRAVVVISGNHDDWQRLSAPSLIAGKHNAYIFGGENIPALGGGKVRANRAGKNFIEIANETQSVYIALVPYPGEVRLGEKRSELSYNERIGQFISEALAENHANLPTVLCSHLFMLGGQKSGDEREVELGGTRLVENSVIPKSVLYTALGHLHKRQVISQSRNIIYSGSPLQYSFDEVGVEKSVTLFEIDDNSVKNIKTVNLESGKKLVKLVADGIESAKNLLSLYPNCFVHLTLKLNEVLSEEESKQLLGGYPQLAEYCLQIASSYDAVEGEARKQLDDKQLFNEYYKNIYGQEVPDEIMQIYLKALNEDKL